MYEKVGESTEVALKVLAEKLNVQGLDKDGLSPAEKATACLRAVEEKFKKVSVLVCSCILGTSTFPLLSLPPSLPLFPSLPPPLSLPPSLPLSGVYAGVLSRPQVNECVLSSVH